MKRPKKEEKKPNLKAETQEIIQEEEQKQEHNPENQEKIAETIDQKQKKKPFTIMGITIWRIFAYFIIYSVIGYIIETLFGIFTKGVWESRQSFLYGPFCAIYGVGAVIMIVFLHRLGKKYNALFIGGFIIGSITEYLVSLIGEMILGVKWWDYSGMPLNIGGRICVYFSIFWGFLGIYLIASVNPMIDRLIEWIKRKFSLKTLKTVTLTTIIVLLIDCIATGFAISFFLIRMIVNHNIPVANQEQVIEQYDKIYGNKPLADFIYEFWNDKKMIRTFPNLKVQDKDGNLVYMDGLLDIQPYYLKVHEKEKKPEEVQQDMNG